MNKENQEVFTNMRKHERLSGLDKRRNSFTKSSGNISLTVLRWDGSTYRCFIRRYHANGEPVLCWKCLFLSHLYEVDDSMIPFVVEACKDFK